jgi:hypothetical protein
MLLLSGSVPGDRSLDSVIFCKYFLLVAVVIFIIFFKYLFFFKHWNYSLFKAFNFVTMCFANV